MNILHYQNEFLLFFYYLKFYTKIFCEKPEFLEPNYNGCIKLKLWIGQKWEYIYIDDKLPTVKGKLYFSRCKNEKNFWMPILEKGIAK